MIVDKIGIEREFFLINKHGIPVEPNLFGFPFDEFGFLVEVRTFPHCNPKDLIADYELRVKSHSKQAKVFGLKLNQTPRMALGMDFINNLREKYSHSHLQDLTCNIYDGVNKSHATGLIAGPCGYIGTAGTHIHFSRYHEGRRVQLPIFNMVKNLDEAFEDEIRVTQRIAGEFEIKNHGFEYRSLSNIMKIEDITRIAFKILYGVQK